jgi:hypothetical protein
MRFCSSSLPKRRASPGENVRQFVANDFEDADPRLFLDAGSKRFLLALRLLLRRRLVAVHAVVNVAFFQDRALVVGVAKGFDAGGKFEHLDVGGAVGPIVMPAHDYIAAG